MTEEYINERQKVYEQPWNELLKTVRAWRADIADQLALLAPLRFKTFGSTDEHGRFIEVTSDIYGSDVDYPKPREVVTAVLKSLGRPASAHEICELGVKGGWRKTTGKAYDSLWGSMSYFATPRDRQRGTQIIAYDPDTDLYTYVGE